MNKLWSFSLVPLAVTATVVSFAFTPDSAQAIGIGTVAISGTTNWSGNTASFTSVTVGSLPTSATGMFDGLESTVVAVKNINFTPILSPQATYAAISDFLTFTNGLKFNLNAGTAEFYNAGLAFEGDFTGLFYDTNGSIVGKGNFGITNSGSSTTFSLSAQAVPEPLTILGTGLALGLGGLFKSKQSKKQAVEV